MPAFVFPLLIVVYTVLSQHLHPHITAPNLQLMQKNRRLPVSDPGKYLSHDHALETSHVALLGSDFKVSVNNSNSEQDTSSAAESTEKIRANRQSTNASTTKCGSRRDDALELLVHGILTVPSHNEALLLELLRDVAGRGAGDLNPCLGEDSAGDEHVYDEDSGLEGIRESLGDAERRRPKLC
jgi:hypothetical protein